MSRHGLDLSTGQIWLDECAKPIRPFMSLDEFLHTFSAVGAFRDPAQLNRPPLPGWPPPPPICHFKKTFCLLDTYLSISLQFSPDENPTLRNIRMFVRRQELSGKIGFFARIRRAVTGSILAGMPKGFRSRKKELETYEAWLLAATGKNDHQQTFPWGELMLVDYRGDCYLFQINYAE